MFVTVLAALLPQKIDGAVQADGLQPGSKARLIAKTEGVDAFEGLNEGLLHDVFGIGPGSGVAEGDTVNLLPVQLEELVKGVLIPFFCQDNEHVVFHLRCFLLIFHPIKR